MLSRDDSWFKFYYRHFTLATSKWTDEKVGAYLRLLIHQYLEGSIPGNENDMKDIITSFKKSWPTVSKKFKKDVDGSFRNEFMSEVRAEREQKVNENRVNGKLGGRPAKKKKSDNHEDIKPHGFEKKPDGYFEQNPIREEGEKKEKEREQEQDSPHPLLNSNLFRKPVIPTKLQVWAVFTGIVSDKQKAKEMAKAFWEKHDATGWFINGSPIVNYVALAHKFISTWQSLEAKPSSQDSSSAPQLKILPSSS